MRWIDVITESGSRQQCDNAIEKGRTQNQAPTEANLRLTRRADRHPRANQKHVWRPEYDEYLKQHYHGGLNRRFQVLNRMIRETGLPRWYIKKRAAHRQIWWARTSFPVLPHCLLARESFAAAHREPPRG